MKIAVLSDIHDNIWALTRAVDAVADMGAARLFFLGDFCAPFTLKQLAEGFSGGIDAVLGNNDGDRRLLSRIASEYENVNIHGEFAEVEIAGRRIALTHYPDIAAAVAEGSRDAVFYGHDHIAYSGQVGQTVLANPGEIMGRFGSSTFGVYDTESQEFRHVTL